MEYFIAALKKFATFSGRSSRKEYWMFTLFLVIFSFAFGFLDVILMNVFDTAGILNSIFMLVMFLPSTAITVRRLHDIDKSGKMILINFIPLIGLIWSLILMLKAGDAQANQYGPVPVDGANTSNPETIGTSNLESVINPNEETMMPQQIMEQPPVQPLQTPIVPSVDPSQPTQEITLPPQEEQIMQK